MVKKTKKIVAVAVLAVMLLTSVLSATMGLWNFGGGSEKAASYTYDNSRVGGGPTGDIDYIADRFDLPNRYGAGGHVFDVLSNARLTHALRQSGGTGANNLLFVLASTMNETSVASLPLINEAAKAFGIENIYYYDVHNSAEYGSEFTNGNDITMDVTGLGFASISFASYWSGEGVPTTGTPDYLTLAQDAVTGLRDVKNSAYKSSDTYLFVYNNVGAGGAATRASIVSELLITDAAQCADEEAFKASVTGVFTGAGFVSVSGVLSTAAGEYPVYYDQYDFFMSWGDSSNAKTITQMNAANFPRSEFGTDGGGRTQFAFESINFTQMMYIMDQPGERLLSMNGSW